MTNIGLEKLLRKGYAEKDGDRYRLTNDGYYRLAQKLKATFERMLDEEGWQVEEGQEQLAIKSFTETMMKLHHGNSFLLLYRLENIPYEKL